MGDLLDGIFGFLGDTNVAALDAFVLWLYGLIVEVFFVLYQIDFALAQFQWGLFETAQKLFKHIWENVIKGVLLGIWAAIKRSQIWNDLRHGKILQFLTDLRKLLDKLFATYVRPILILLQRVRQFLLLLRLLHINIAVKLDAYIAQLEAQIAGAFLTIRGTLNNVVDLANILADPTLLLRKPTLLASLRRIVPALSVVLTRRPINYWFPSPRSPYTGVNPLASSVLGIDDGLAQFPALGFTSIPDNTTVDTLAPLEYFVDELYPAPSCDDPALCLAIAIVSPLPAGG